MYLFHPTHQEFLFAMLDEHVEFLLIGGYAVNYHGYIRATGDMDIWLKPDNQNKLKLLKAFEKVGIHPDDVKLVNDTFDFTNIVVFHFGNNPERIDFLTKVGGVDFLKAYARKQTLMIKEKEIPVLHLEDLIISKILADRPQDKVDVEMLQQINRK
ncbi:MAG: nucleotidyltransferase [Bacteroidetes bacterium]|nr:nucleotidyltransferase [Bacteroidota bacterium]